MRPRDLSPEEKQRLRALITAWLEEKREILFAYVYGSFVQAPFRDIDIAVFLADGSIGLSDPLRYELTLAQELEEATGVPIDVRVLTTAPLSFAFTVIRTGEILVSRDEEARCEFICRILVEYHDFSYHRERYRREVLGLLR
ncbi:MAG TPA: nucleotidyltransferase domain-containing protein [Methanoculleus sp.]|nr:nucleotidyltransferase domain-containing protein [Methanoculleus sp.]